MIRIIIGKPETMIRVGRIMFYKDKEITGFYYENSNHSIKLNWSNFLSLLKGNYNAKRN